MAETSLVLGLAGFASALVFRKAPYFGRIREFIWKKSAPPGPIFLRSVPDWPHSPVLSLFRNPISGGIVLPADIIYNEMNVPVNKDGVKLEEEPIAFLPLTRNSGFFGELIYCLVCLGTVFTIGLSVFWHIREGSSIHYAVISTLAAVAVASFAGLTSSFFIETPAVDIVE